MPGQVTGRWTVHACRLTILSDDLPRAHAFPSMSRSTGGGGRKEKKRGEKRVTGFAKTRRRRILFGSLLLEKRGGEKRREDQGGKKSIYRFRFCIHFTHMERNNRERERERSLEIEARKLFCWSSITRGYRGGSKNLSKKKWTFVWQRRWLISRIGAIIRHMRVFLSFAYLPDATNRETMQSRETHDHTRNAKLG